MQDTFYIEDELLLKFCEDVGDIHHGGNEEQHTNIGGDIGSVYKCKEYESWRRC